MGGERIHSKRGGAHRKDPFTAMASTHVKATLFILLAFFLAAITMSNMMLPTQVESFTRGIGKGGPLLIAMFLFLTQVFAPLSGTPVMIISIKLYGYPTAMAILYGTCLLSSIVNFWIARVYGRTLLVKLVGDRSLKTIDELSGLREEALLIAFRILGYSFFDLVSYAVGLTLIDFKKYFAYTAVLTLIPFFVQYIVFARLNFDSTSGMLTYIAGIVIGATVFAAVLRRIYLSTGTSSDNQGKNTS